MQLLVQPQTRVSSTKGSLLVWGLLQTHGTTGHRTQDTGHKMVDYKLGDCIVTPMLLQFPRMTDSVSIEYNSEVGRHGVATEKINPGD